MKWLNIHNGKLTEKFMKKKAAFCVMIFFICLGVMSALRCPEVQAAPKTGTYSKTFKLKEKVESHPCYMVTVNKVKNKKIRFQITYLGRNASPIYESNVINAKLKNKTAFFKWKDNWGNAGTGKIKLYNGYIKIKVDETKTAGGNRATLDTNGKYRTIKRKSSYKEVY